MRIDYSRNDIVEAVSDKTGYDKMAVGKVFVALEETVSDLLATTTDEDGVRVQPIYGIFINSSYTANGYGGTPTCHLKIRLADKYEEGVRANVRETMRLWEEYKERKGNEQYD